MKYFKFDLLGTLNGKPRLLRYDVMAIDDLESVFGKGLFAMLREDAGVRFTNHLVWAGIKHQDEDLTPRDVGRLIQKHVIDAGKGDVTTVLRAAMRAVVKSGILQAISQDSEEAKKAIESLRLGLDDEDFEEGGHRPPGLPADVEPAGSGEVIEVAGTAEEVPSK